MLVSNMQVYSGVYSEKYGSLQKKKVEFNVG